MKSGLSGNALRAAAAVFPLLALLYGLTAMTLPGWHDSAELSLRALQLGATHAPGAPGYTLLAHLATLLCDSPAAATTGFSVLSGALAGAALAALLAAMSGSLLVGIAGALVCGTLFPVWGNAVITELYAPSLLAATLAFAEAWRWRQAGANSTPVWLALLLGLALSAHFANILLLPGFIVFVALAGGGGASLRFTILLGALLVLVALGNVWLAAKLPPFGLHVPDSIAGLYLYMSGAEHRVATDPTAGFYIGRVAEHTAIFLRNFVYIGIVPMVCGAYVLLRRCGDYAGLLVLSLCMYLGYFTLFGSGDYFVMVNPAYLLATVLLVCGLVALARRWLAGTLHPDTVVAATLLALAAFNVAVQFDGRRAAAVDTATLEFADDSFALFPQGALVVARWNEFTVLRYMQVVTGARPDIRLLVPARSERHYSHGTVADYIAAVDTALCAGVAVLSNREDNDTRTRYRAEPAGRAGVSDWVQLRLRNRYNCGEQ